MSLRSSAYWTVAPTTWFTFLRQSNNKEHGAVQSWAAPLSYASAAIHLIDFEKKSVRLSRICPMASAPMRHLSSPSTTYLKPIWKPRQHWWNPPFRTIYVGALCSRWAYCCKQANLQHSKKRHQTPLFQSPEEWSFIPCPSSSLMKWWLKALPRPKQTKA